MIGRLPENREPAKDGQKRAIVLRAGTEIGRARIQLPQDDFQTEVLTLAASAAGKPRWIAVGVPGHQGEDSELLDTGVLSEARLPQAFLDDLRPIIRKAATTTLRCKKSAP